jgi:hypothetical protein
MDVPARSIAEDLDVVEHVRPCLLPGTIESPSDPLFLQTAEKRFRHSVVETVPPATHARDKTVVLAKPHPVVASVLGPLIGVNDDRLLGTTAGTPPSHKLAISSITETGSMEKFRTNIFRMKGRESRHQLH